MPDFVVARNPDAESSLPYLIRLPLGPHGVVLKAGDSWPRTSKVFCHPETDWPEDAEVLERVPVRSCVRRGAAIDLILDRARENRSQLVFTRIRGGRDAIFWQTPRTTKQARPNVGLPTKRSAGGPLSILVDSHEQYPWRFSHQQANTERRSLDAGDYAVELDGQVVAAVERKSLPDLVASLTSGRLRFALGELAALPRAAVVVEERYSSVFRLEHIRPSVVADGLAECQVRFPSVPIVFCETRALAQEWAYRFLGAALAELASLPAADLRASHLRPAPQLEPLGRPPLPPAPRKRGGQAAAVAGGGSGGGQEPSTAEVRAWAVALGIPVSARGRLRPEVWDAYRAANAAAE